jgi:tetratricopeptide (TPR) repeat protein
MKELTKVYLVDPDDEDAKRLEMEIYEARQAQIKRKDGARRWREEHLKKVEALQKQLAEQALRQREEEEKRALRCAKVEASLKKVEEFYRMRQYDKARSEIETIYAIDPSNTKAQDIEMDILNDLNRRDEARRVFEQRANRGAIWKREEDMKERAANERRSSLRKEGVTLYRSFLKHLWEEGVPGPEEIALTKAVRMSLGINENDHNVMERSIRVETYTEALRKMLATNGGATVGDIDATESLRKHLDISLDQHLTIMENLLGERDGN